MITDAEELTGRLGPGWLGRLEFVIEESANVPPGVALVDADPTRLRVYVADAAAFRWALHLAEVTAEVRRIFDAELVKFARRWGVPYDRPMARPRPTRRT